MRLGFAFMGGGGGFEAGFEADNVETEEGLENDTEDA